MTEVVGGLQYTRWNSVQIRFPLWRRFMWWKITTRGFTLQEVLIMAAMNVVTRTDSDRQRRANDLAQPSVPRLTGI
jgi:hypothetical protein